MRLPCAERPVIFPILILARILQGAAGGALQPMSQAIMLESFPEKNAVRAWRCLPWAWWWLPVLGPTLGGWITDNYSWRWIFYINVPIGVLATWMITMFVEDPPYLKAGPRGGVDTIGFAFLALWLSTMQVALDKGQELDWFGSPAITLCIVVSAGSFVAFVVRELTTPFPLVDLSIFRNGNFAVGTGLVALLGALLYGTTAILPLLMQGLLDYSATDAGLALSPRGIAAFLAALLAGRLIGLVGGRTLIIVGFSLMTLSVALLGGINLQVGMGQLIMPIMLAGFAITFIFVPLSVISMGDLPARANRRGHRHVQLDAQPRWKPRHFSARNLRNARIAKDTGRSGRTFLELEPHFHRISRKAGDDPGVAVRLGQRNPSSSAARLQPPSATGGLTRLCGRLPAPDMDLLHRHALGFLAEERRSRKEGVACPLRTAIQADGILSADDLSDVRFFVIAIQTRDLTTC